MKSRRDFGAVSDGPVARVPRVPIGSSRQLQDGGDSYLRRGRPEPGTHGRPERHHQLPEEEQGLWGWWRWPSAAVHCGHATVGAEWTAAGVNRAPSPGPAPRSVLIEHEGSAQGKLGEGPPGQPLIPSPCPVLPSPAHPSPLHKRGQCSLLWWRQGRKTCMEMSWDLCTMSVLGPTTLNSALPNNSFPDNQDSLRAFTLKWFLMKKKHGKELTFRILCWSLWHSPSYPGSLKLGLSYRTF